MRHIKELINIDSQFQRSVNLQLDLGDEKRLNHYIPTTSSVEILKRYLENIIKEQKENATVLIGPYGKGKSHLLLVLLAILQGKTEEISGVLSGIAQVDRQTAEIIRHLNREHKRFLPVLISGGADLNLSFVYALREALERENLTEIIPESNYSEAVRVIEHWEQNYPQVYKRLKQELSKETPEELKQRLARMDEGAMEQFLHCYPKLTAGSRFLPMVEQEAYRVYQEVNRKLQEQYGYSGIFLVFDEFSKYVEGQDKQRFAGNMKVLQDMCELANRSGQQMFLTLVAHKSIHEYEKGIDKSVKNAFRGVEGRLKEIPFVVTARNNYELIADTLRKKEPEFSRWFQKYEGVTGYGRIAEESQKLPCFFGVFASQEQYQQIVERGCFPLTPVCACALLHISAQAAQNERTVFTFLTAREPGSLPELLDQFPDRWIGVDAIYDYFKGMFRENSDQPKLHNEWLKADYALSRTKDSEERRIIKATAILRMIHREDELPVQDLSLRLGLGMEETVYQNAMERLKQQGIIIYRSSRGVYAFKNNVGVDVEKELQKEVSKLPVRFPVCRYLSELSELSYVLPKYHNQKRSMTRYFQYEFMEAENFFQMTRTETLFEGKFSDGKILALISENPIEEKAVAEKTKELSEDRLVVLLADREFDQTLQLKRLAAIRSLEKNPEFVEDNQVLLRELALYEEDIVFEVNVVLERDFIPGYGGCQVFYRAELPKRFAREMEFNRFLSEICERYYQFSPRVNHELLNIRKVTGQYLRARNKVIQALLSGDTEKFREGTSPECMVYRAAFVRTGIVDPEFEKDTGCIRILTEIDRFFAECSGKCISFETLYQRLQGRDYGVRRGILPLFIAQRLVLVEGTPVIYLQNKELAVNDTVLNQVNEFPGNYELYIEPESGAKEQYLKSLEKLWNIEQQVYFSRQSRWVSIVKAMQDWYCSLPQYTLVTEEFPAGELKKIRAFRKMLRGLELNPRELLFEKLPRLSEHSKAAGKTETAKISEFSENRELADTVRMLVKLKRTMDGAFSDLQDRVIARMKELYGGKPEENLKSCLLFWYRNQSSRIKEHILSASADAFLKYLDRLDTNNEREIVGQTSKLVWDIHMEDWRDETFEQFSEELTRIRGEVESLADNEESQGENTIILQDASGHQIKRSYTANISDTTGGYLKNVIYEAMEDFGDSLEPGQKVAVLAEVLQGLME